MASLGILKELHVGVSWLVCAIVLPSFWVVVVVLWISSVHINRLEPITASPFMTTLLNGT